MDYALSPQQLAVICALSNGATLTAAAAEAGLHRNTITGWRRNSLPFQHALADAQYDRAMLYREKMEELVDLAVEALQQILSDPAASPNVRLKAALAVVTLAAKPPEPKRQVELLIEEVKVAPAPIPVRTPAPVPPQPQPQQTDTPLHNSAQAPIRRDHPKVGRNELCPCGSTLKFKRCCLGKPAAAAAA